MSTPHLSSTSQPSTYAIAISSALLGLLSGYFLTTALSLNLFSSSSPSRSSSTTNPPSKSWPNSYDVTIHPDSSSSEDLSSPRPATSAREELDAEGSSPNTSDSEAIEAAPHVHHHLSTFPTHKHSPYKLVIVMRTDLDLSPGKTAAQASHATLLTYRLLATRAPAQSRRKFFASPSPTWDPGPNPVLERWEAQGQTKIVVGLGAKGGKMGRRKQGEEGKGDGDGAAGAGAGASSFAGGEKGLLEVVEEAKRRGLAAGVIRDAGRTEVAGGTATCCAVGPGPAEVVDAVTGGLRLL